MYSEAVIKMYSTRLCMRGCHDLLHGGTPAALAYWDVVSMAAAASCRAASAADCAMLLAWSPAPDCWDMMPVQHDTETQLSCLLLLCGMFSSVLLCQ